MITAASTPGNSRCTRLPPIISTTVPAANAMAVQLQSSGRDSALAAAAITPPSGSTSKTLGSCEEMITTAAPAVNPVTTGSDSRYATRPMRTSPSSRRTSPTSRASSAALVM